MHSCTGVHINVQCVGICRYLQNTAHFLSHIHKCSLEALVNTWSLNYGFLLSFKAGVKRSAETPDARQTPASGTTAVMIRHNLIVTDAARVPGVHKSRRVAATEFNGDVEREDDGVALKRCAVIPGGGRGVGGGKLWLPRHSAPTAPCRRKAMAQHVVV